MTVNTATPALLLLVTLADRGCPGLPTVSLGLPQVLSPGHPCLSTLSPAEVYLWWPLQTDGLPSPPPLVPRDTAAQLRGLAFRASSPFVIRCVVSSRARTKVSLMAESELLVEILASLRLFLIIKHLCCMTSVVTPGFQCFKKDLY